MEFYCPEFKNDFLRDDYLNNSEKLNIKNAMQNLSIPVLICHSQSDEAVPVETAYELHSLNKSASLFIVDSDHVFGRKHPSTEAIVPTAMQEVVDKSINFLKQL